MKTFFAVLLAVLLSNSAARAVPFYTDDSVHTQSFAFFLRSPSQYVWDFTNGVNFSLTFELTSAGFGNPNFFDLNWSGIPLMYLTDQSPFTRTYTFANIGSTTWVDFQFSPNIFTVRNIQIDQVSGPSVPDSGTTFWLLAAGVAALLALSGIGRAARRV